MRWLWVWVAVVAGCAPPPPVDVTSSDTDVSDPEIKILYPPRDVGELPLDPDCHLRFTAVVDINNFDFVPAGGESTDVDGHGHYHLYPAYPEPKYFPGSAQYLQVDYFTESIRDDIGGNYAIQVELQTNTHQPIECPSCTDTIEYVLTDPNDCQPSSDTGS